MPEILNLFNIYKINASWSIDACPRSVRGFHERFSLHWFPYWPVRASPALCLHCALAACISLSPRSAAFVCGLWLDNPAGRQRQLPTAGSVSSWGQTQSRETERCERRELITRVQVMLCYYAPYTVGLSEAALQLEWRSLTVYRIESMTFSLEHHFRHSALD